MQDGKCYASPHLFLITEKNEGILLSSQFSSFMTFKLREKFSDTSLKVSETMEINGKRTFGYDEPIVYKRI